MIHITYFGAAKSVKIGCLIPKLLWYIIFIIIKDISHRGIGQYCQWCSWVLQRFGVFWYHTFSHYYYYHPNHLYFLPVWNSVIAAATLGSPGSLLFLWLQIISCSCCHIIMIIPFMVNSCWKHPFLPDYQT